MKQRILITLLACVMLLAGCEKAAAPQESTDGKPRPTIVPNAYVEPTEAPSITMGGYPWLDTNLKENLTEGMELSPKDDFYLYVNYDWLMNSEIPDGYSELVGVLESLEDQARDFFAILEDESVTGRDADLMRDIFGIVFDWDARNADGIKPMMKTLEDIRGISSMEELEEFLCDPEKTFKVPLFVTFENVLNMDNSFQYLFAIRSGKFILGDPEEYETRTELGNRTYEAAKDFVRKMLVRAGYDEKEADEVFEATIELETKLAKGMKDSGNAWLYEKPSEKELWYYSTNFPLMQVVDAYGYGDANSCACENLQYLKNLDGIYKKKNLGKIKDYLTVKFVMEAASFLDQESNAAHGEYSNRVYGRNGEASYETLMYFNFIRSYWGDLMMRTYLLKHDAKPEKERLEKLIREVIAEYREMLQEEDWLSAETKAKAIEKLNYVRILAGYPENLRSYDSVDVKGMNYWEFGKLNNRLLREADAAKTNGTADKESWNDSPMYGTAVYSVGNNSITIPLALLFGDWYHEGTSDEELYAWVGTVIGHEISHAFDSQGATRNKDGQSTDWWSAEDKKAFEGRMEKLQAYFGNVTVWEGNPVSAEKICDEACADIGGMKVMLRLAKKQENFDYDKFFRSFAESRRALDSREYQEYKMLRDVHLAYFLRVNSTLQQFEEFAETYDLKEGDRMYLAPEDRVQVW